MSAFSQVMQTALWVVLGLGVIVVNHLVLHEIPQLDGVGLGIMAGGAAGFNHGAYQPPPGGK